MLVNLGSCVICFKNKRTINNGEWTFNTQSNNNATIIAYTGTDTNVIVPLAVSQEN